MTARASRFQALALSLFAAALSSSSLSAQQTLIVDLDNRPGAQFTEIQPAIDAADPGDTILVRPPLDPVSYKGFLVQKALRVIGGPGVLIGRDRRGGSSWHISVQGLPAGTVAVLGGLRVWPAPTNNFGALLLKNNTGAVHAEELSITGNTRVENAHQVSFRNSAFRDITTINSQVLLSECSGQGLLLNFQLVPALEARAGSKVTLAGGYYSGQNGNNLILYSGPGMIVHPSAKVFVTGDFNTTIRAGTKSIDPGDLGQPAIVTTGGELVLDPDPAITPSGQNPAISGPALVQIARIPYLHADVSGGTLTTTLETWGGAQARLYYSPFRLPFVFQSLSPDVWVGRPTRIVNTTVPSTGVQQNSFALPPFQQGTAYPLQALVIHEGQLYLSNPVVTILAP